jgi:hypothetical protein
VDQSRGNLVEHVGLFADVGDGERSQGGGG